MSTLDAVAFDELGRALGWALVHFVWQGCAAAALYAVVRAAVDERGARARYAAGCVALAVMVAAPAVTFAILYPGVPQPASTAAPASAAVDVAALEAASAPAGTGLVRVALEAGRERLDGAMPWLVALWLAGVAVLSLRFAGAWVAARRIASRRCYPSAREWQDRLERLAARLEVTRPVRLCESAIAEVPSVIGWLKPVVVVPAGLFAGMDPRQIEAILAHELAHVRRYDYLVNLLQSAAETLLFYHPAVWWVSREIREERERCCDDVAVAACGDVLVYATALAELESLRTLPPAAALAASGGSLLARVRRLLAPAPQRTSSPGSAAALAVATVAALLAGTHAPGAAATSDPQGDPPVPPAAPSAPAAPTPPSDVFALLPMADLPPDPPIPPIPPVPPVPPVPLVPPSRPDLHDQQNGVDIDDDSVEAIREALQVRDYDQLDGAQRDALGRMGVTPDFVAEMHALGLGRLDVQKLIGLASTGVTADYARSLQSVGVEFSSANQIIALKVHDVTAETVRELSAVGLRGLTANQLVAGQVHGVSPEFVREVRGLGFDPTLNQLVAMRVHDVTPGFVQKYRELGYEPTISQLLALKIHDVTPQFIDEANGRAGARLPIDELIRLRITGTDE